MGAFWFGRVWHVTSMPFTFSVTKQLGSVRKTETWRDLFRYRESTSTCQYIMHSSTYLGLVWELIWVQTNEARATYRINNVGQTLWLLSKRLKTFLQYCRFLCLCYRNLTIFFSFLFFFQRCRFSFFKIIAYQFSFSLKI